MTCMNTIRGRVGAISYLVAGGCLVVWWRMHVQTELPANFLPFLEFPWTPQGALS
jgi:hypothetical protein